jgi:hypothetical protein
LRAERIALLGSELRLRRSQGGFNAWHQEGDATMQGAHCE